MEKDNLYRWYVEEVMSLREIATKCNVSPNTVMRRLQHHGIPLRGKSERRGRNADGTPHLTGRWNAGTGRSELQEYVERLDVRAVTPAVAEIIGWNRKARVRIGVMGVSGQRIGAASGVSTDELEVLLSAAAQLPGARLMWRLEDALGVPRGWLATPATLMVAASEAARIPLPAWLNPS